MYQWFLEGFLPSEKETPKKRAHFCVWPLLGPPTLIPGTATAELGPRGEAFDGWGRRAGASGRRAEGSRAGLWRRIPTQPGLPFWLDLLPSHALVNAEGLSVPCR